VAHVHFAVQLRAHTGGVEQLDVAGSNYRELVANIAAIYPELGPILSEEVAVAIDGEIIAEPFLEAVRPDSEVHFLHRIAGG
jgi:hypothetical protein